MTVVDPITQCTLNWQKFCDDLSLGRQTVMALLDEEPTGSLSHDDLVANGAIRCDRLTAVIVRSIWDLKDDGLIDYEYSDGRELVVQKGILCEPG